MGDEGAKTNLYLNLLGTDEKKPIYFSSDPKFEILLRKHYLR